MEYKLLPTVPRPRHSGSRSSSQPTQAAGAGRILDVHVKPHTRSMNRFDIEVEGNHNYFVDGVMVHNSPETTTGGKALKFYASVRLDVRRIETLKDGTDAVGNRTRVKVVKNKVAPPFKQAEFDILYGKGISREGSLIDMGVDQGFIRKSGSWFTYEGEQLGQGKENARNFLMENADVANEIEKKIKEKLGIGAVVTDDRRPARPRRLLSHLARSWRGHCACACSPRGREPGPSCPASWPNADTPTTSVTGYWTGWPPSAWWMTPTSPNSGCSPGGRTRERASARWPPSCTPRASTTT